MTLKSVIDGCLEQGTLTQEGCRTHPKYGASEVFHHEWVRVTDPKGNTQLGCLILASSAPYIMHLMDTKELALWADFDEADYKITEWLDL